MQEFLELILKNIVKHSSDLKIEKEEIELGKVEYKIFLNDEDKGLVIGQSGRNIKAIRNLLSILAKREGVLVNIKIVD